MLHAAWNALVKHGGDPFLRLAVVNLTGSAICLPFLLFVAAAGGRGLALAPGLGRASTSPTARPCAWPTAWAISARSTPSPAGSRRRWWPCSAGWWPGRTPSWSGLAAIGLISCGILVIAFGKRAPGQGPRPLLLAMCCGATIGAYTICDGLGIRAAQGTLEYIVWFFFLDGLPFGLTVLWLCRRRIRASLPTVLLPAIGGGVLSFLAYGLVIWAMRTTPMAYVSGLRETSVILATIIGTRLMGEPFGRERITAACIVAGGIGLLKLAG